MFYADIRVKNKVSVIDDVPEHGIKMLLLYIIYSLIVIPEGRGVSV